MTWTGDITAPAGQDAEFPNSVKVYMGPSIGWVFESLTGVPVNTASNVVFTPGGTISSNNVQAALLELSSESVPTTRVIQTAGLLTGSQNLATDPTLTVNVASQADATAGIRNDIAMTPLRVYQSIVANAPSGGGFVNEAPSDGTAYGRKNAAWTRVVQLTGDTMTGNLGVGGDVNVGGNIFAQGGQISVANSTSSLRLITSGGANFIESGNAAWTASADLYIAGYQSNALGTAHIQAYTTSVWGDLNVGGYLYSASYIATGGNVIASSEVIAGNGNYSYGVGALYSNGSTTNPGYLFLGNITHSERVRLLGDDSRKFYVSCDSAATFPLTVVTPQVSVTPSTASTTPTTGALVVTGGAGVGGQLSVGANLSITGMATGRLGLQINNTVNASSAVGWGIANTPVINASANNDTLFGTYVSAAFTAGSFTGTTSYELYLSSTSTCANKWGIYQSTTFSNYLAGALTVNLALSTNSTLTATGVSSFGSTTLPSTGVVRIAWDASLQNCIATMSSNDSSYGGNVAVFYKSGATLCGWISQNNTPGITYNSASDARWKTDQREFDGIAILEKLKPYNFKWRTTGDRAHGMFAQEAMEVYPEAVNYSQADDVYGIDYSRFVPVLVSALQQALKRITALEAMMGEKHA